MLSEKRTVWTVNITSGNFIVIVFAQSPTICPITSERYI